jgi:hypothetical protein
MKGIFLKTHEFENRGALGVDRKRHSMHLAQTDSATTSPLSFSLSFLTCKAYLGNPPAEMLIRVILRVLPPIIPINA